MVGVAAFTLFISTAYSVYAVSPNPLENAYWHFDEGPAGTHVPANGHDPVLDSSGNANHLDVFDAGVAPTYTDQVAPTPLKSGYTDSLALSFTPNNDLITLFGDDNLHRGGLGKHINNGTIANGGGFTLEAAFRPSALGVFQAIVAKEGQPAKDDGNANSPLPTLELKIRDNNKLQIELFDGAKNVVSVSSQASLNDNQWYYAAAVNDGSNLALYLDSNDGSGYQLQGTVPVVNALYQGTNGYGASPAPDWSNSWTFGRGQYNGSPADFFSGVIDEVRLSNKALQPWQFLFAPQGDYNGDKIVDAGDYDIWRKTNIFGANGYTLWRNNFGKDYNVAGSGSLATSIPEPASLVIAAIALAGVAAVRRRNRQ
jgi:hypothetical protein